MNCYFDIIPISFFLFLFVEVSEKKKKVKQLQTYFVSNEVSIVEKKFLTGNSSIFSIVKVLQYVTEIDLNILHMLLNLFDIHMPKMSFTEKKT